MELITSLHLTDFENALRTIDIVIPGEGGIDEQTLQGKGHFGVAMSTKAKVIPVIGIAGKVPGMENMQMNRYFNILMLIGHEPSDLSSALGDSKENLKRTSAAISKS